MSDDRAQPTAEAADLWRAAAAGWVRNADLIDRMSAPIRRWIVDRLEPKAGETILELAAGTGDTGFEVAQKLGADGRLISSDIAQPMLDAGRQRAGRLGVSNVEFRVVDAQHIDLEDASVDGVIHRYGPMLLPDPDASFAEVRRVLRSGGRYICTVWTGPEHNPWVMMTGMSLMQNGIQPPGDPFGPGGMFSLAEPDALRQRIADAGFTDVRVETQENPFEFTDFDELWKVPTEIAGPIAVIIAGLDAEQVERVKETFRGLAEPFRSGEGYHPPAQSLCVLAR